MKIIFDKEEQKQKFLEVLAGSANTCPDDCYFKVLRFNDCTPTTKDNCAKCWEQCGIEYEVKSDEKLVDILVGTGTSNNADTELMSKEDWMNKRLDDIRKAMDLKTRMLQIIPIEWVYEYNELVAKLSGGENE